MCVVVMAMVGWMGAGMELVLGRHTVFGRCVLFCYSIILLCGSLECELCAVAEGFMFCTHSSCPVADQSQILVVRAAKERDRAVTCEVCPHHLFLTASDGSRMKGRRSEVRPTLGTSDDVKALWDNMDIIDCFATDHGQCYSMCVHCPRTCAFDLASRKKRCTCA